MPGQTRPSPFPERCLSQRALLQEMLVSCLVQVQAAGTDPECKRFGRAGQHSAQHSGYRCLLRRGAEQLLQGTAPSCQQHLNELGNRGCVGWHREGVVEAKSNIPACVKAQLSTAPAQRAAGEQPRVWGAALGAGGGGELWAAPSGWVRGLWAALAVCRGDFTTDGQSRDLSAALHFCVSSQLCSES